MVNWVQTHITKQNEAEEEEEEEEEKKTTTPPPPQQQQQQQLTTIKLQLHFLGLCFQPMGTEGRSHPQPPNWQESITHTQATSIYLLVLCFVWLCVCVFQTHENSTSATGALEDCNQPECAKTLIGGAGRGAVVGSRSMGGGGGPLQLCLISSRRERKIMELFSDMMSKFTCLTLLLAGKG
jgi:hypothetical protein